MSFYLANKLKKKLNLDIYKKSYLKEDLITFEKFNGLPSDIYLEGEWAGDKYFLFAEKQLKSELSLKTNILNSKVVSMLNEIKNESSVSVHIRRGDFVGNKLQYNLPLEYYKNAIDFIKKNIRTPKFYIFSDDTKWIKENFGSDDSNVVVEGNQNYEDLELMKNCKHNIIANSGFSWIAAWLNKNEDKLIISPNKWVQSIDYNELMIESLKIKNMIYI